MPRADRDPQGASVPVDWLEAVLREVRLICVMHKTPVECAEWTDCEYVPDIPALAAAVRRAVEERINAIEHDEDKEWLGTWAQGVADVRARLAP